MGKKQIVKLLSDIQFHIDIIFCFFIAVLDLFLEQIIDCTAIPVVWKHLHAEKAGRQLCNKCACA